MKHRLFYLSLFAALGYTGMANAQTTDCSNTNWGSYTHYEVGPVEYTPVPQDFAPVFINYVGRHGASHMQKDVFATFVYKQLLKADSTNALTSDGIKLRKMLDLIQGIEKSKINTITQWGIDEMKGIGITTLQHFPGAVTKKCIVVSTVNEPRMTQSAEALLEGMGHKLDEPGCVKINYNDDDNLRPLTVAGVLKTFAEKDEWKDNAETVRDAKRASTLNEKFLTRLFKPDFYEKMDDVTQDHFIDDLYEISLITNNIPNETLAAGTTWEDTNIRSFFSCQQLELFNRAHSAGEFYKSGPGSDKAGIQVRAAIPLLLNLISTTDANSLSTSVGADIRISSSEVVASLATLMNFKGVNKVSLDPNKFDKVWKAEEMIPSAANIQWILYQSTVKATAGDFIIKFMLNEHEVEIDGLKSTIDTPYYQWSEVKKYLLNRMHDEFEIVTVTENMHSFLQNMKAQ